MNRDDALKKILKCLRLAKSSNPNEAATALRHARKLMDEYGITDADAVTAEYSEATSKTCGRGKSLPPSIAMLIYMVADGFRCATVCNVKRKTWGAAPSISVAFVGRGADPTVAAYAFDVLRRQLDKDRMQHITRVRKRANREARGEEFAQGWVAAVERLFPAVALDERETQALRAALMRHGRWVTEAQFARTTSMPVGMRVRKHDCIPALPARVSGGLVMADLIARALGRR